MHHKRWFLAALAVAAVLAAVSVPIETSAWWGLSAGSTWSLLPLAASASLSSTAGELP